VHTSLPATQPGGLAPHPRFASARLATGPRLRYAEWGEPIAPPIVFLHGYTDSWFSFSRLLPHLSPRRHHAYALDQRGHGDSERPIGGYRVDDFAADAVAFLDAVGVARATLVGHSLGSVIARRVAETHPQRVARLVLIGAVGTPVNAAVRQLLEVVRALPDPVPTDFVRDFQVSTAHQPLPEPFLAQVVAESLKLPARVWRAALQALVDTDDSAELARLRLPTLVLWGDRDAYFPRQEQDRLAAAIPGARLTVYTETGHSPHWERPERVARDLEAFLDGA
jgi:non-heme chloroperoxidase